MLQNGNGRLMQKVDLWITMISTVQELLRLSFKSYRNKNATNVDAFYSDLWPGSHGGSQKGINEILNELALYI